MNTSIIPKRQQKTYIFTGGKGRGKSELIMRIFVPKMEENANRNIIVLNPRQEAKWGETGFRLVPNLKPETIKGVRKIEYTPQNKYLGRDKNKNKIYETDIEMINRVLVEIGELKNSFVIFDDATEFFGSNLNAYLRKLVSTQRQKNLDFYFVFHNVEMIPTDLIRLLPEYYFIFASGDGTGIRGNEKLMRAQSVCSYYGEEVKGIFAQIDTKGNVSFQRLNMNSKGEINPLKKIILFKKELLINGYLKSLAKNKNTFL